MSVTIQLNRTQFKLERRAQTKTQTQKDPCEITILVLTLTDNCVSMKDHVTGEKRHENRSFRKLKKNQLSKCNATNVMAFVQLKKKKRRHELTNTNPGFTAECRICYSYSVIWIDIMIPGFV